MYITAKSCMMLLNTCTFSGCSETDGAIWSKGFSTGKHVFEIVFPVKVRAPYASIGIGTKNSELHAKKPMSLVGQANYSWGIDLASKKVFSNGLLVGKFPDSIFSKIPDRFYMYLDLVNFRLMFGSDGKYFGVALEDETMKNFALYPMVSLTREGAAVTMVYRGVGTYKFIGIILVEIKQIRTYNVYNGLITTNIQK